MSHWSENMIARALADQTFSRRAVVLVPNCNWTDHECDLLVVEQGLRIIDVEIKISRADLKADAAKTKWWHTRIFGDVDSDGLPTVRARGRGADVKTVWKHYYCLPYEIWDDSLIEYLPSRASGVIGLREGRKSGRIYAEVIRKTKPAKNPYRCSEQDVLNIARLANLRLWSLHSDIARMQAEMIRMKEGAAV